MFLFSIMLIGYVWASAPCNAAEIESPPLDIVEAILLQIVAAIGGGFCGLVTRTVRKLGEAPAPVRENLSPEEQADAVQEKV